MQHLKQDKVGAVEDVISLDKPRILYLYAIYDSQAEESAPPFCAVNDNIARRCVVRMLSESDFPDDYKLLKIGIYDPGIPAIMDVMNERIDFSLDLHHYKEYKRLNSEVQK